MLYYIAEVRWVNETKDVSKAKLSHSEKLANSRIYYAKLFWLFIFGSLIGVVVEGLYCLFVHGHWQTHVVSMWGPFCILYGIGFVGFYVGAVKLRDKNIVLRFLVYALVGSGTELLSGLFLDKVLNMYAWNYNGQFLVVQGVISFEMTVAWGLLGILFEFAVPLADRIFDKWKGKAWDIIVIIFSAFMAVNFIFTCICIARWAQRHKGKQARNRFESYVDSRYDDKYMKKRFVEWDFLDGVKIDGQIF